MDPGTICTITESTHPLAGARVELTKIWKSGIAPVKLLESRNGYTKGDVLFLPVINLTPVEGPTDAAVVRPDEAGERRVAPDSVGRSGSGDELAGGSAPDA